MAEIEFLLPTVQYGNVKVRATPEELGIDGVQDAGALGVAAAVYLNLFTQGFKVGTQVDVTYDDGGPKPPPPAPIERVEVDPEELIKTQLGATTVSEDYTADPTVPDDEPEGENENIPWNRQAVDTKPKPWETGTTPPQNVVKVAEINWS